MLENNITTITKKCSMTIGSKSWREGIKYKTTNIASGFRASGLWISSFGDMKRHLKLFKDGSIALSEDNPTWIRCRDTDKVDVLSLPPPMC